MITNKLKQNYSWIISAILILLIITTFCDRAAASTPSFEIKDLSITIDNLWVLICSILVLGMSAGFAMLEAGFCRAKNTVNILFKNLITPAIATISFYALGFAFAYGDGNNVIGLSGFFLRGLDNSPAIGVGYQGVYTALSWAEISLSGKFLFAVTFAGTAATIVSGAVAERIRLITYICFSIVLSAFIYPIAVRWVWGGGWLWDLGFYDFAGSSVVYSVGGWAALVGVLVLGPRTEKYRNGRTVALPAPSLPLSTAGVFVLWLCWFGFNCGSTLDFSRHVLDIALNTFLSGCAGAITAAITSWWRFSKPDHSLVLNGVLAGLVACTACANAVGNLDAIAIGAVAGVLVVISILSLERLKIDDPVGAISVHLVNGIWGTIAVGLFANPIHYHGSDIPHQGLFYGGNPTELITQVFGIFAIGIFTIVTSFLSWKILDLLFNVRVSLFDEERGLDLSEHSLEAYGDFNSKARNFSELNLNNNPEKEETK